MSWYSHIYNHCIVLGRHGLTIPYLVGAVRVEKNEPNYNINDLLNEVISKDVSEELILRYCNDIRAHIIGIENPIYSTIKYLKIEPYGSLYIDDDDLNTLGDMNKIIEQLEVLYGKPIRENTYSRKGWPYSWQKLDDDDLRHIENVSNKYLL